MKFKVNVSRTIIQNGYILIDADNEDEAKDMAMYESDEDEFVWEEEDMAPDIEITSTELESNHSGDTGE